MPRVSRPASFATVLSVYLLAGAVAAIFALALSGPPLLDTLVADVAATVVVFMWSTALRNASVYDPYWSVAPPVIALAWALGSGASGETARQVVVVALVVAWGLRLTANWAGGWRGLEHEDWRYVELRASRVPFWIVNLLGIQLMPTLLVFAGCLSLWPALTGDRGLNLLDAAALVVTVAAIATEALADLQLHRQLRDPGRAPGAIADRGLWRVSRHPNYLGQIGFWWGLWLFGLAADPSWWWTVAGPLAMVGLFVFVSVPLMDRRSLARRPGYAEHMRAVPALVPLPGRGARASGRG
jgi:steroid 5-alpha reductase family enzyme